MASGLEPDYKNANPNKPYEFDLDQFGAPLLNSKNVEFVRALLKHDSRYRDSQATKNSIKEITEKLLRFQTDTPDRDGIKQAVKLVDKLNSTRLQAGGNQTIPNTINTISEIDGLIDRIKHGDYSLVDIIASAGSNNKKNFSFATKFCTYLNIWCFGNENRFVVFDRVLERILPYYACMYASDDALSLYQNVLLTPSGKIRKSINMKRDASSYRNYCAIVQNVREQVNTSKNENLTCRNIEQLIWYYFRQSDVRTHRLDGAWDSIRV